MPHVIQIADAASGASAQILDLGFNCFSFRVPHAGSQLETLWAAPDFAAGGGRPSGSGIPLLFPFPGRIRGRRFTFQGRDYELPGDDGRGNAIHGFVLNRAWKIAEQTSSRVVGVFQASEVDREILRHWPSDFRLTVSYEVRDCALLSQITAENCGAGPLPCAFGTHPYFRVPLGGADAAACRVHVPASATWELAELLPTGERRPAEGRFDLAHGMKFSDTQFDDVFTGLSFEGDRCVTSIADPGGRRLVMTFDRAFRECVVYNPPHREAICIEPYTAVPDPYVLGAAGHDTGLRVLAPGERWEMRIEIRVE